MTKEKFVDLFKEKNFIRISDNLIVFNDFELFNISKNKSTKYKNIDDLLTNEEVKNLIENAEDFEMKLEGGRGSRSSSSSMGGGFRNSGGKGGEGGGKTLFPAKIHVGSVNKTQEQAIRKFEKQYKNATIEYAASIDAEGFAHSLRSGDRTSVIPGVQEKMMIVHNHPSGGHFSKADLLNAAANKKSLGVIAVGSNPNRARYRYTFTKTGRFKDKAFTKAVATAQWPSNLSYDDGADWWLRKNARKFGYKYSKKKIS